MKAKVFQARVYGGQGIGTDADILESEINDWLAENANIKIHNTSLSTTPFPEPPENKIKVFAATYIVLYEE